MSRIDPSELARQLADSAERVCRHYLSAGRREGNWWLAGDARNTPGRSLFVRLHDSPDGVAGKWSDAATGEHGDLLDLIRTSCGCGGFREAAEEARRFLSLPSPEPRKPREAKSSKSASPKSSSSAQRLFAMAQSIAGTLAETYLHARGIAPGPGTDALRFHPRCYYRAEDGAREAWPAMIASVTALAGRMVAAHRTWLAPTDIGARGGGKAPVDTPRKAIGPIRGNAVRFGIVGEVMAAGEGIETTLAVRQVLPTMPMAAALSATNLAALHFPDSLRCLYILRDNDLAGTQATSRLADRASQAGIKAVILEPSLGDFNEDLLELGPDTMRDRLRAQLLPADAARFLE